MHGVDQCCYIAALSFCTREAILLFPSIPSHVNQRVLGYAWGMRSRANIPLLLCSLVRLAVAVGSLHDAVNIALCSASANALWYVWAVSRTHRLLVQAIEPQSCRRRRLLRSRSDLVDRVERMAKDSIYTIATWSVSRCSSPW